MRLFLQTIYLIVHLGLLAVFAAAMSARYVHPAAEWWPQVLAIGLPPLVIVVLVFAIVDLLMRRWVLFAITALGLILFAGRYASAFTRDVEDGGRPLVVGTINSGGTDVMERDRVAVAPLLLNVKPDILCVQEMGIGYRGSDEQSHEVLHPITDSLGYTIIAPDKIPEHREPPPIVSRLDLRDVEVIGLSTRRDTGPAGTVVRARFDWDGQEFVVYNMHLQSFTTQRPWLQGETFSPRAWLLFIRRTRSAFLQRSSEAEEIRAFIEQEDRPVLVCGDFNTTPHQFTYRQLAENLRDAYRTQGGIWGATYPAAFPLVRIDYILTSDHWLVDDVSVGPKLPADHIPVIARLRLKANS